MKIKYLAFTISAALATSISTYAEETKTNKSAEKEIETIQVVGIKRSMMSANDLKRMFISSSDEH
jgi:hypothetical protein